MDNSYHSLITTLKSPFFVFCCNKFIINPDFVVLLQVTILKRSQIANDSDRYSSRSVGSVMILDSDYRSMRRLREGIRFVCGYLSIAVSLSLSSSFVLMFYEANILLWQTVVTLT